MSVEWVACDEKVLEAGESGCVVPVCGHLR